MDTSVGNKDLALKAKAKDLALKAKDLTPEAKELDLNAKAKDWRHLKAMEKKLEMGNCQHVAVLQGDEIKCRQQNWL